MTTLCRSSCQMTQTWWTHLHATASTFRWLKANSRAASPPCSATSCSHSLLLPACFSFSVGLAATAVATTPWVAWAVRPPVACVSLMLHTCLTTSQCTGRPHLQPPLRLVHYLHLPSRLAEALSAVCVHRHGWWPHGLRQEQVQVPGNARHRHHV